jgi:N-acetylneuraminic acid mutarotase
MSGSASALIVLSALSIEWGWMAGSNIVNARGVYGTMGVPAPSNAPGARQGSAAWTDPAGGIWLFGGRGLALNAIEGFMNDLWRFDPATGQWTWVSGSSSQNQNGVFGIRGTVHPANVPGARYDGALCQDPGGNFWLFGGYGFCSNLGGWVNGNDLWKYDPGTRLWTWISGSSSGDQAGFYGTKGLADPANVPGARRHALLWVDPARTLWLFGGTGFGSESGHGGMLNDLWKYDPTEDQWTWVSGSDMVDQPGVFGTKGVADPANVPGAKTGAVPWIDLDGDLWLFGGSGPGYVHSNDLWTFEVATGLWTWMSGSDQAGQAGIYGTKGVAAPSNVPGGRVLAVPFRDPGGRLWLFGGAGYDSAGANTVLNDLWMFDPVTSEWTWVSGGPLGMEIGLYGTKGETDPSNRPGARYYGVSWVDTLGNFWLFGGWGNDAYGGFTFLNDLWKGIR